MRHSTRRIDYDEVDHKRKNLTRKVKDNKLLHKIMSQHLEKLHSEKHTDYLTDEEAYAYYFDMILAQKYAEYNRMTILKNILKGLNLDFVNEPICSIHNYIDFNDMILRKGAVAAHKDNLVIISLNMRDGILLCKGLGSSEWNYSTAHGCGRLFTRQQSENNISLELFKETMKDIYSSSVVKETIDEAPQSYKDTSLIKNLIQDSVEIIEQLKPIINIKAFN